MILRRILLENFGLYRGKVELDLTPQRRGGGVRPVVVVGGKNGTGKTTLLEAVRLALYGRRALGARVAQSEYETYLQGRIHRGGGSAPTITAAAVGLDFDYAEGGQFHRYRVQRAWASRGRSVVESLLLEKDGTSVTAVPRDEWHHFLQELIPPGVSQLFFFDGERIQEIAEGDQDEEQLASAVRGLLGLELVARLRTDLGLYLARHRSEEDDALVDRLEPILRDLDVLERQVGSLTDDLAQLASTRESHARAAEQARRRFVAEGGELAARRSQLEAELQDVTQQLGRLQAELRDHANALLPFTVAPRLTRAFRAALRELALRESGGRLEVASVLLGCLAHWRSAKSPQRNADWSTDHWTDLRRFLDAWAQGSSAIHRPLATVDIGDRRAAIARLEDADNATRPRVAALADELEALYARQQDVEAMLLRADKNVTSALLDELRLAEQRVGATEATLRAREEELKRLRAQQTLLERERSRILDQQSNVAAVRQRTSLASRVSGTLAEYERRLLDQKLGQLRKEFVRCFGRLARKKDLVVDVRIDPMSFEVALIDHHGRHIPKAALSAGEKQVYAIAILWALARTSGLPLPMIIDTPLARLDSDHRASLVEHYFPTASHQVVMLSTDTEVDTSLFSLLGDSVSHAFRLEYQPTDGCTVVQPGYFSTARGAWGKGRALQQA